jgi:hypothetical protein
VKDFDIKNNLMNSVVENFILAQRFKFTNRHVFSFSFTNFFSLFLFFSGPPHGPVAHRAEGV